ncbi:MAG: hypothetical protein HY291_16200 [Planctomycetes bacterium]|nr:hypothetical protein [Planctomycetota bacterium]
MAPDPAPNAMRMRRWFQLHLSTAVVLMFVAGSLIWANVPRHEIRVEMVNSNMDQAIFWHYETHEIPMNQPIECRTESETCGWPIQWQNYGDSTLQGEPLRSWGLVVTWRAYVYDAASWLGIFLFAAFACEYLARRRERARAQQEALRPNA